MAPQVLYCTQITERTQKWRCLHQKTITQKIQGTASAKLRINQQWWQLNKQLLKKLHLSTTVGHKRFTIVNSWLLHCYSEFQELLQGE